MIWIILLGLIAGWRECQILCERGSWYYANFRNWFWFTNQADKKASNWDSFHVSNGLFALVLCISLATCTNEFFYWVSQFITDALHIIAYWWFFFYIRNLGLHIIFRRKAFRQWKYLLPIQKIGS